MNDKTSRNKLLIARYFFAVFAVFYLCPPNHRWIVLLLSSICFYVLAGVIRLAFFNVCAEKLSVEVAFSTDEACDFVSKIFGVEPF